MASAFIFSAVLMALHNGDELQRHVLDNECAFAVADTVGRLRGKSDSDGYLLPFDQFKLRFSDFECAVGKEIVVGYLVDRGFYGKQRRFNIYDSKTLDFKMFLPSGRSAMDTHKTEL